MAKGFFLNERDWDRIQRMLKWFRLNERGGMAPRRQRQGGSSTGGGSSWAQITSLSSVGSGKIAVKLLNTSGSQTGDAFDVYIRKSKSTSAFTVADWLPTLATSGDDSYVFIQQVGSDWVLMAPTLLPMQTITVIEDMDVTSNVVRKTYRTSVKVFDDGTQAGPTGITGGTGTNC